MRLSILLLAGLVLVASRAGFDFVLGAFAAGLIVGLLLDSREGHIVRMRLEGISDAPTLAPTRTRRSVEP